MHNRLSAITPIRSEPIIMISYKITYFGKNGRTLNTRIVTCEGHWEACEFGWHHMPARAEDFRVQEETFGADRKPEAISDDEILKALEALKTRVEAARI